MSTFGVIVALTIFVVGSLVVSLGSLLVELFTEDE